MSQKKKKILIIACIVIAVAAIIGLAITSHEQSSEPLAAAPEKKPDYTIFLGNWVRQTGGYVIEISEILQDGQVNAAYFNPRPINVSRASASNEGSILKLFVELRDQGYPGSTYDLRYNSEYDALVGIYFQASMRQSFDVVFKRKK